MLVAFEIPEGNMPPETAAILAERSTLWVFASEWRIYPGPGIEVLDNLFRPVDGSLD